MYVPGLVWPYFDGIQGFGQGPDLSVWIRDGIGYTPFQCPPFFCLFTLVTNRPSPPAGDGPGIGGASSRASPSRLRPKPPQWRVRWIFVAQGSTYHSTISRWAEVFTMTPSPLQGCNNNSAARRVRWLPHRWPASLPASLKAGL